MSERATLRLKSPTITWCVWRTDSSRVRKAHSTYRDAVAEANRLASLYPGQRFLVMQSVRTVRRRTET